jgi:DNA replication and repair protein RecF
VRVTRVRLRNFRTYPDVEVHLGPSLTVVHGRNGAGKTNLLEAIYFACTGRSCRTANEREVVRFGAPAAHVDLFAEDADGPCALAVGFAPGEPKRLVADGAPVARLLDVERRPLVSVFLPDRLDLVKGTPALRRAHLDAVLAAVWPARRATRAAYGRALAQRNALIGRIRAGLARPDSLDAWDAALAGPGIGLMGDRAALVDALAEPFAALASALGLDGAPEVAYRPRSRAASPDELAGELRERRERDLDRGFTEHGPHRDDLALRRDGRELRAYGSQGQQRLALLALLLAERDLLERSRSAPPLMLLDDVMSELDSSRREHLVDLLRGSGGQSVITTTDLAHVPGADRGDTARLAVTDGAVLQAAAA